MTCTKHCLLHNLFLRCWFNLFCFDHRKTFHFFQLIFCLLAGLAPPLGLRAYLPDCCLLSAAVWVTFYFRYSSSAGIACHFHQKHKKKPENINIVFCALVGQLNCSLVVKHLCHALDSLAVLAFWLSDLLLYTIPCTMCKWAAWMARGGVANGKQLCCTTSDQVVNIFTLRL